MWHIHAPNNKDNTGKQARHTTFIPVTPVVASGPAVVKARKYRPDAGSPGRGMDRPVPETSLCLFLSRLASPRIKA